MGARRRWQRGGGVMAAPASGKGVPNGAGPRGKLRSVGADEPPDPRPLIRVRKGEGHPAIVSSLAALAADDDLYERNQGLVHVVGAPEPAEGDRAPIAAGTPVVRSMAGPTLWERASKAARWERWDGRAGEWVRCDPPPPVLAALLSRGAYPGIRHLTGILEAPGLRPDGSLIFGRGYDPPTGYLCLPTVDIEPPPETPSEKQGRGAMGELREVFQDFPHRDESSRMVPISGLLTLVARPAILGCVPGHGFDASTRGSGKTLQADAVSMIYSGRVPPPMSYPVEDEELEKVLGALALAAPAIVKFDNLTTPFGGGPIDRVLTARDTTTFRVLGRSETPELAWRSVVLYTGNNIEHRGDSTRRVIVARVESPLENPEDRPVAEFLHPDLLGWIKKERGRLLRAALTVLRAFIVAGRPGVGTKTWGGGFESWSALIPPAIVYCGGADPMLSRPAATGDEEPEKAALASVLMGLARLDEDRKGMTVRDIVGRLYQNGKARPADAAPDGWEDFREALESLAPPKQGLAPDPKRLGDRLRTLGKGRVISGARLVSDPGHGGVKRWRVEHVAAKLTPYQELQAQLGIAVTP
ncbi:MAG TPA: hypothetical protein VFS09_06545 [Candidatus Eisenbacteria bacterium]|nr:hypothetical protein [Candidatus Eisenbacteria bacterium]